MPISSTNIIRCGAAFLGLRPVCPFLHDKLPLASHPASSRATIPALKQTLLPSAPITTKRNVYTPSSSTMYEKQNITCWIDAASSTGLIAAVNESWHEYELFKLKAGWKSDGRDINWMEAIGFELLASWLIARRFAGEVVVNCDSTAALLVFAGKKKGSLHLRDVGLRLESGRQKWPFAMRAQWVKGQFNRADRLSRGKKEPGYKRAKCTIEIPEELKVFVSRMS